MLTHRYKTGFAGIHESNYIPVQSDEVIEINAVLTAAEPNPNLDPNLDAQWPTFRANRFNNGVVDYPIPTIANDSVLYWQPSSAAVTAQMHAAAPSLLMIFCTSMQEPISTKLIKRAVRHLSQSPWWQAQVLRLILPPMRTA